ncbi:MAG: glycosyltransferase family 2 protein [Planctomycetota bacterium]
MDPDRGSEAKNRTIVVIPAKDEASRIGPVISKTVEYAGNVVVVDDGSADETGKAARNAGAIVLRHRINLGMGAAVRTGCLAAYRLGAEYIVTIDADGQHRPEDIPAVVEPLTSGDFDIVFTARAMGIGESMPVILNFGNRFFSRLSSLLFGIRVRDTQSGFRAMTRDAFRKVCWNASDYALASEIVFHTARAKLRYSEVEIPTIYLDRHKGTNALDGIPILVQMIMWRIFPWAITPR